VEDPELVERALRLARRDLRYLAIKARAGRVLGLGSR